MLKGKDNSAAYTIFLFIAAFLDRVTGCNEETVLGTIQSASSDIVNQPLHCSSNSEKKRISKSITRDINQKL